MAYEIKKILQQWKKRAYNIWLPKKAKIFTVLSILNINNTKNID